MKDELKIISVDDNLVNLMLMESFAEVLGYEVSSFENPKKALDYVSQNGFDLAFVDYMMPDMDGVTLIKELRQYDTLAPIIMVTAVNDDDDVKIKALEAGATDFLTKPLNAVEFNARFKNLLDLRIGQLKIHNKALLLQDEIQKATETIRNRELEALNLLAKAAEFRDENTGNHILRVGKYSKLIAKGCGEDEKFQDMIFSASPLHDIGKIGISDSILNKPGKLTEEEMNIMKTHSYIGYNILKDAESPYVKMGAEISLYHHEKYNGQGYPNGVSGNDIPISSRIVAVADVFDALTSKRPYKDAWPLEKAFNLLIEEKNKHFDPVLVDCFIENKDEITKIFNKYNNL
jgi:putative two-component system response regulator